MDRGVDFMEDLIRVELLLFSHVLKNLCNDEQPYLPQQTIQQLLTLYPWPEICIHNRISWYATTYYIHCSFGESVRKKKEALLDQLAHLIQQEKQSKTLCIDPIGIDTSERITIPSEICAFLRQYTEKD